MRLKFVMPSINALVRLRMENMSVSGKSIRGRKIEIKLSYSQTFEFNSYMEMWSNTILLTVWCRPYLPSVIVNFH